MVRGKPAQKHSVSRRVGRGGTYLASYAGITPAEVLGPLLWLLEAVGVSRREILATVRAVPSADSRYPLPLYAANSHTGPHR